jgi:hypothetical protein
MKIFEIAENKKQVLAEAKARIDHPEDAIFDDNGIKGAARTMDAMLYAAKNLASSTTVKWDGTPAILFGWIDGENFLVTDKAGIGAKKYDGRPMSANALSAMIYNRKPDEAGRSEYAGKFASLYEPLKAITPKRLQGKIIQGDLLWMDNNDLELNDDSISFKPNKVQYDVPVNSDLGKAIKRSIAGIAVHSYFDTLEQASDPTGEPAPISPTALNMKSGKGMIVFGPETNIPTATKIKLPVKEIDSIKRMMQMPAAQQIDDMLDPFTMGNLKISNFPELCKKFINTKAGAGQSLADNDLAQEFIDWVKNGAGLTANKQQNILAHIEQFKGAFALTWKIVAGMTSVKENIKAQLDRAVGGDVKTSGHEGYVSDTPQGKIKFVNRPVFMKKAE